MEQVEKRVCLRKYIVFTIVGGQVRVLYWLSIFRKKVIRKISSTVCILAENQKKLHKNKATITYN